MSGQHLDVTSGYRIVTATCMNELDVRDMVPTGWPLSEGAL